MLGCCFAIINGSVQTEVRNVKVSELIGQLWTPQMQTAFTIVVVLLVVLYILCIIWVVRDAYLRGTTWYIWGIVALVPIVGLIAYLLMRPPMLRLDRDEQELEVALKQRQLMQYGECATCGYPVDSSFVLCPNCHTQLKNLCTHCERALEPAWTVCPYCATPLHREARSSANRAPRRAKRPTSAKPTQATEAK